MLGIPSGTLYGKVKREGIETPRKESSNWSEENLLEALECVRAHELSINQASIKYNLPYSTLYNRFKKEQRQFPTDAMYAYQTEDYSIEDEDS